VLKAHGFHGARGAANVARVAGLAKYDSYIIKNGLRQFGEAPKDAKIAFYRTTR
jgi:hypothetical protein